MAKYNFSYLANLALKFYKLAKYRFLYLANLAYCFNKWPNIAYPVGISFTPGRNKA
jgi:hypothetical protein